MPDDAVHVVVIAHNSEHELADCLAEIGSSLPVTVVDVASQDRSAELVEREFPQVTLLRLPENVGFGSAANIGVAATESPFVLLANADAWPVGDAIPRLAEAAADDPRLAIVAPSLRNRDGTPQRSIFGYPRTAGSLALWAACPGIVSRIYALGRRIRPARRSVAAAETELISSPRFPSGAALLLRRSAFDEAGGFDARFFMYSEETDLCERVRQRGWAVAAVADAVFVHVGGASSSPVRAAMYREQLRSYLIFLAKHESPGRAERARRLLARSLRIRAAVDPASKELELAKTSAWIGESDLDTLIREPKERST